MYRSAAAGSSPGSAGARRRRREPGKEDEVIDTEYVDADKK